MATKSQLISDIILRITKGKPADDLELEPKQVAFWLSMVLEGMIKDQLDALAEDGQDIPTFYVVKETCRQIQEEAYDCIEDEDERLYFDLRKPIYELNEDRAVVRVITNEGSFIHKAKLANIDFVSNMEFSKPSVRNLVYYRDGKRRIVVLGIPRELKNVVEVIIWYVPSVDIECFGDDEELPISDDLLEEVQLRVEEIARRQMFGFADVDNNGLDDLPNGLNG